MNALEKAFEFIEKNKKFADFDGPKDESIVKAAETVLGFSFPESYRKFIMTYGCGDILGCEFYGLTKNVDFVNAGIPNAVGVTLRERHDGFPEWYLIVGDDGIDSYYVLDVGRGGAGKEAPVYKCPRWITVYDEGCELVCDSFGGFLYSSLLAAQ